MDNKELEKTIGEFIDAMARHRIEDYLSGYKAEMSATEFTHTLADSFQEICHEMKLPKEDADVLSEFVGRVVSRAATNLFYHEEKDND